MINFSKYPVYPAYKIIGDENELLVWNSGDVDDAEGIFIIYKDGVPKEVNYSIKLKTILKTRLKDYRGWGLNCTEINKEEYLKWSFRVVYLNDFVKEMKTSQSIVILHGRFVRRISMPELYEQYPSLISKHIPKKELDHLRSIEGWYKWGYVLEEEFREYMFKQLNELRYKYTKYI